MAIKALAPGLGVSPQVDAATIAAAKAAGYRAIINNRPDREEPGQPPSAALEAQVRAAGLAYHHIPVVPGAYSDADIDAFREAMAACDGPALAFCRSGMRATALWALAQAGKLSTDEILREAATCGYDLTGLAPRLEARARTVRG